MAKNTAVLEDVNIGDSIIVWVTDMEATEIAHEVADSAGTWWDSPDGGGKLLLSDQWNLRVYGGQELTESDVLNGYGTVTLDAEGDPETGEANFL